LIDDSKTARLDVQARGDIDNYRYSAPEILFPEDHSQQIDPVTVRADIYGIGMIIYEASSRCPGGLGSM